MNFPAQPSASPALLSPQVFQGRRILLEGDVARAIGVSVEELQLVTRQYAECFPGSCSFSVSAWELQQRCPDVADNDEEWTKTTVVYTETGAAMAAVLLQTRTSPERIATLLRAYQSRRRGEHFKET